MRHELKTIASKLGVPDTLEHILQRIGELDQPVTQIKALNARIDSLINQRDEFEKMLHEEQNVNCRMLEQYTKMKKRYESVVEVARNVYMADLEDPNV